MFTVYPAIPDAFPAASFKTTGDALGYAAQMTGHGGVCMCRADTYPYKQLCWQPCPDQQQLAFEFTYGD